MFLLVLIIFGVAIFCFTKGYVIIGIICLAGFSKHIGFPALIVTSLYLFIKDNWVIGILPLLLIGWNIIGGKLLKKNET